MMDAVRRFIVPVARLMRNSRRFQAKFVLVIALCSIAVVVIQMTLNGAIFKTKIAGEETKPKLSFSSVCSHEYLQNCSYVTYSDIIGATNFMNKSEYHVFFNGSESKISEAITNLNVSCEPKIIRIACSPSPANEYAHLFSCSKEILMEEYEYESQYPCLVQLSKQVLAAQNAYESANGKPLTLISPIGHSVFFYGKGQMKFYHSLSIISLIRYLKPKIYLLWNDGLPQGRWWNELVNRIQHPNYTESFGIKNAPKNYSLKFISVRRNRPINIYSKTIHFIAHSSDIVRLQSMISFGGAYLDFDAFAVNDLNPLMHSPFVLGYEKWGMLNNGVMFGARQSDFGVLWHCQYAIDYDPGQWLDHSVLRSHALAEACPHLIRRENSSLDQPNNFGNIHLLFGDDVYFNLSNNYVVHSWMWQYKVEIDEKVILGLRHTMGRIWRSLYYGELKPLN